MDLLNRLSTVVFRLYATSHIRHYARALWRRKATLSWWRSRQRATAPAEARRWLDTKYALDPTSAYWIHHVEDRGSKDLETAWQLYERIIERMKHLTDAHEAVLCLFCAGGESGMLAWEKYWNRIRESQNGEIVVEWQGREYALRYGRHIERLEQIASRLDVLFIANRRSYTRFIHNPHPNAEGNVHMAEDIFQFLTIHPRTAVMLDRCREDAGRRSSTGA